METQAAAAGKNATRLGAHLVFDESAFMMIPPVRRTWAPVGQTPVVRHYYRRDRISVIGGLSVSPERRRLGLYFRMHAKSISPEGGLRFPVVPAPTSARSRDRRVGQRLDPRPQVPERSVAQISATSPGVSAPPTLHNSTQSKPPGMPPSSLLPMAGPKISAISGAHCSAVCARPAVRNPPCVAPCCNPSCPIFLRRILHYLCESH